MAKTTLDVGLLDKITRLSGKKMKYVREQISKRANRAGISSLSAQILWAKELRVGTANALNRAPDSVRQEVRDGLHPADVAIRPAEGAARTKKQVARREKVLDSATVNFVLTDDSLRDRCRDLILANRHYDRALREATTVLEDRIKTLSGIKNLTSVPLIAKALNPDPTKSVMVVSSEKEDQAGFFYICNGVMQAFRNKTHHNLINSFSQADALKFCGFIDALLAIVATAQVHSDRR